jgi:5-methylcytosine-specific restriction protein A
MPWGPFEEQQTYNRRRDIHGRYGGQQQGGICTPNGHPVVICFTGETGEQHGYSDGWADGGVFRYFGEGQIGPMEFVRGNRAIRDHLVDGKDLLLFQTRGREGVRFLGQFECAGYLTEKAPDRDGAIRDAIVFKFVPVSGDVRETPAGSAAEPTQEMSIQELRKRAYVAARVTPQASGKDARRILYQRAGDVRAYVLARAGGVCESCGDQAPFVTKAGQPYLEPHHTRRLSDGGPDDPRFVAGVCPACHREIHYGKDGEQKNATLAAAIAAKERLLGS